MGYGDELMASGMARGSRAMGRLIAFGDRKEIRWSHWAHQIFINNPNVAWPGKKPDLPLLWVPHYKGLRMYNHQGNGRWIWHYGFRPTPGEMFFTDEELLWAEKKTRDVGGPGFIVIEPNVPVHKSVAPNKQWPLGRFQEVAHKLGKGRALVQIAYEGMRYKLGEAQQIKSPSFRHGLALMANAKLFVGPEGGLHHGAAAVGVRAVVIFGGFIPPEITGYDSHINLAAGGKACGMWTRCQHCVDALEAIPVSRVFDAAMEILDGRTEPPAA